MSNEFFIISKRVSQNMYDCYQKALEKIGKVSFISDEPSLVNKLNVYFYPDDLMVKEGFWGSHSKIKVTAWDKVFWHLKGITLTSDYFWIIEDDCYLDNNNDQFSQFVQSLIPTDLTIFGWYKSFSKGDKWSNWRLNEGIKGKFFANEHLNASINQLVRLSPTMVTEILNYQISKGRLPFHEIFLVSLAKSKELQMELNVNSQIRLNALKQNSLVNELQHKNLTDKDIIQHLRGRRIILTHPFKLWYDELIQ